MLPAEVLHRAGPQSSQAGARVGRSTALTLSGPGTVPRPAERAALACCQRSDPSLVLAHTPARSRDPCAQQGSRSCCHSPAARDCTGSLLCSHWVRFLLGCSPASCSLGASCSCPWPRAQRVWAGSGGGCWHGLRTASPPGRAGLQVTLCETQNSSPQRSETRHQPLPWG